MTAQPAPVALNPRVIVTRSVESRAAQFPHLSIGGLDVTGLPDRDAALAIAIDQAVARRWITLSTLLDGLLEQSWERLEPAVQASLLVGAAQLLLLERLPVHAVVDQAVRATKSGPRPRASGLVNAVLRKLADLRDTIVDRHEKDAPDQMPLSDGRAWRLCRPVFSTQPLQQLAEKTSHPLPLLEHWQRHLGASVTEELANHSMVHPPIVLTGIEGGDDELQPHDQPGFFIFSGRRGELTRLLDRWPTARVQDVTAAAPVAATRALNPSVIIDVCAGRGTKTRQLRLLHPGAKIIATDVDGDRRSSLHRAFEGDEQVSVVRPELLREHIGAADLVLLDVPCSNSGVLARRMEAKYRLDPRSLTALTDLQRQIIADALPLLSDSGTLLYSTCSVEAAENEDQARWAAHWHPLEIDLMRHRLPSGQPGGPPNTYTDGGFFARLRKAQ